MHSLNGIRQAWIGAEPRTRALLLAVIVTFIAAIQLSPLLIWSPETVAARGLFRDDGYFFSVIARNYHELGVLSLDGSMETNGFQPLWMAVQIGVVGLFPNVHEATLLAWSCWTCFLVFAFLSTWYMASVWPSRAALCAVSFAATVVLNARFQRAALQGVETPLLVIILVATLLLLRRLAAKVDSGARPTTLDAGLLALASVLCFFTRTDFFWLAIVVGLWLLAYARAPLRRVVLYGLLVGGAVVPYLLWNARAYGSIVPISGRVKKFYLSLHHPTFESYLASDEWWGLPYALTNSFFPPWLGMTPRLPVAFAMLVGAFLAVRWFRRFHRVPTEMTLLTATLGLHAFFMYAYHRELRVSTFYYFIPHVLWFWMVVSLFLAAMADGTSRGNKVRRWPQVVAGFFSVGALLSCAMIFKPIPYWSQRVELVRDIRRLVPEHEKIGAFWPGMFAQFSGRTVVPMDGIIGSEEYFRDYVKHNAQFRYLEERNIRYIALWLDYSPQRLLAGPRKRTRTWHVLGQLRLWEVREHVAEVLSSRPLPDKEYGWYLLRLDWGATKKE